MPTETLQSANAIRVPDRAGEVIINRLVWPVTAKANGDKVIIGYVPANCRIHAPDSQVIADGNTAATTFDVCVDQDTAKIAAAVAVTAATFSRSAVTAYQAVETIGRSTGNRPVYLLLSTAPTTAGGNVIVDLAVYDPGF